eukprot:TRINITY_DN16370_c0_g1_i2.p1 TRINITY_DN16370_c0_g1~~TRINITY_DN16370_c0_g1_i2.p1  ORF type:complete len:1367 (+),score=134.45 TRINITY_DN16370_c0_g1_i2:39-4139(+)
MYFSFIPFLGLFIPLNVFTVSSHRLLESDRRDTLIFKGPGDDANCSCCPGWQRRSSISCTQKAESDNYCLTSNGYICPDGYTRIRTKTECMKAGAAFDAKNEFWPMLVSRDRWDPRGCWLWEESGQTHTYWNPHRGAFNSCAPRQLRNSICIREGQGQAQAPAAALLEDSALTSKSDDKKMLLTEVTVKTEPGQAAALLEDSALSNRSDGKKLPPMEATAQTEAVLQTSELRDEYDGSAFPLDDAPVQKSVLPPYSSKAAALTESFTALNATVATQPQVWFCVVRQVANLVLGPFTSATDARDELNKEGGSQANPQMICQMGLNGVKADPHIVGGLNQGAGEAGGFKKWWANWNNIHLMNQRCENDCKQASYCVVRLNSNKVIGTFTSISDARNELNKEQGSASNQQMICEMGLDGKAKFDPHTIGGFSQGGGAAAGFNKWWSNWDKIKEMNDLCDSQCKQAVPAAGACCDGGSSCMLCPYGNTFAASQLCASGRRCKKEATCDIGHCWDDRVDVVIRRRRRRRRRKTTCGKWMEELVKHDHGGYSPHGACMKVTRDEPGSCCECRGNCPNNKKDEAATCNPSACRDDPASVHDHGDATCGSRMDWLKKAKNGGYSDEAACKRVTLEAPGPCCACMGNCPDNREIDKADPECRDETDYTFRYEGHVYQVLPASPKDDPMPDFEKNDCKKDRLIGRIPKGYALAPYSDQVVANVIAKYKWGADGVVFFDNQKAYATLGNGVAGRDLDIKHKVFETGPHRHLNFRRVRYELKECDYRMLIRKACKAEPECREDTAWTVRYGDHVYQTMPIAGKTDDGNKPFKCDDNYKKIDQLPVGYAAARYDPEVVENVVKPYKWGTVGIAFYDVQKVYKTDKTGEGGALLYGKDEQYIKRHMHNEHIHYHDFKAKRCGYKLLVRKECQVPAEKWNPKDDDADSDAGDDDPPDNPDADDPEPDSETSWVQTQIGACESSDWVNDRPVKDTGASLDECKLSCGASCIGVSLSKAGKCYLHDACPSGISTQWTEYNTYLKTSTQVTNWVEIPGGACQSTADAKPGVGGNRISLEECQESCKESCVAISLTNHYGQCYVHEQCTNGVPKDAISDAPRDSKTYLKTSTGAGGGGAPGGDGSASCEDTWVPTPIWGTTPNERCQKWATTEEAWGVKKSGKSLDEHCKEPWARLNCAKTCSCPQGASCADTWDDNTVATTPEERCKIWSENSEWGALVSGETKESSCKGDWARANCAQTCGCPKAPDEASCSDSWVPTPIWGKTPFERCQKWATTDESWGVKQSGKSLEDHCKEPWAILNCAFTCSCPKWNPADGGGAECGDGDGDDPAEEDEDDPPDEPEDDPGDERWLDSYGRTSLAELCI